MDPDEGRARARCRRGGHEDDRRAPSDEAGRIEEPAERSDAVRARAEDGTWARDDAVTSASLATTSGSGEKAMIGTCGRSDERIRAVQPVRV